MTALVEEGSGEEKLSPSFCFNEEENVLQCLSSFSSLGSLLEGEEGEEEEKPDEVLMEKKFQGLLEVICSSVGFEVGEIWQARHFEDESNASLQFRQIHISKVSDEQRSHLQCPDSDDKVTDLSKHKVSPVLCRNACDTEQIVWVNAKACEELVMKTHSPLPINTAAAIPCVVSADVVFVIVLFSVHHRQLSHQVVDLFCAILCFCFVKNSNEHTLLQNYFLHKNLNDNNSSDSRPPVVFLGEADPIVQTQHNSSMSYSSGSTTFQDRSERYRHFMSGIIQLSPFDIAELWLPDTKTDSSTELKMAMSQFDDTSMQQWADFSRLISLAPGLDIPGQVASSNAPLLDDKYDAHTPGEASYPRALYAKYVGLKVAFGVPVTGNEQCCGTIVFYSKESVLLADALQSLIRSGSALLTSKDATPSPSEPSHVVPSSPGSGLEETKDNKDSKDLIGMAFMSALDTIFENDTDWGVICQDGYDDGNSSSLHQQQQQHSGEAVVNDGLRTVESDGQFKGLTSRIYSETLCRNQNSVDIVNMSKRSRTGNGADISHGISPSSQHQQFQVTASASASREPCVYTSCVNCHKLSETVNGYCRDCSHVLAAYFSRNNSSFHSHRPESMASQEYESHQYQQPPQRQLQPHQVPYHRMVVYPPPVREHETILWSHFPGNAGPGHGPQYEMRSKYYEDLDVSRHSYQSDLDASQHSSASYQNVDYGHQDPNIDLNSFRSTLDIGRGMRGHSVHSDPLDVKHHPVNVNRYHFVNTQHSDALDVSRHSNHSDADNDLDKTHHPVNVDRYRHRPSNSRSEVSNVSTHSMESNRSTLSERNGSSSKRKICRFEGCLEVAIFRSPYCSSHAGNRKCMFEGCTKCAQGSTKFCISHGGGRRCTFEGCTKGARDKYFCAAHGGGKRCTMPGCDKSAVGRSTFCTSHGGGKRCMEPGCTKSSQSSTNFCVRHGGGRKCALVGCNKVARGRTNFCASHKKQDTPPEKTTKKIEAPPSAASTSHSQRQEITAPPAPSTSSEKAPSSAAMVISESSSRNIIANASVDQSEKKPAAEGESSVVYI